MSSSECHFLLVSLAVFIFHRPQWPVQNALCPITTKDNIKLAGGVIKCLSENMIGNRNHFNCLITHLLQHFMCLENKYLVLHVANCDVRL